MIGANEFHFNLATVQEMVQHYLDTVLFKSEAAVEVANVSFSPGSHDHLIVRTKPSAKPPSVP